MTDYPIRRPIHSRPAPVRPMPFRSGRAHPFAIREDATAEQTAGIDAKTLADRRARKKRP